MPSFFCNLVRIRRILITGSEQQNSSDAGDLSSQQDDGSGVAGVIRDVEAGRGGLGKKSRPKSARVDYGDIYGANQNGTTRSVSAEVSRTKSCCVVC